MQNVEGEGQLSSVICYGGRGDLNQGALLGGSVFQMSEGQGWQSPSNHSPADRGRSEVCTHRLTLRPLGPHSCRLQPVGVRINQGRALWLLLLSEAALV